MPFKLPSKLPFGGGAGGESSEKPKEPSLDDVLPTRELRVELVLLLALCTDAMRDSLNDTFQPAAGQKKTEYTAALNRDDLWGNRAAETAVQEAGVRYLNQWRTELLRKTGEALGVASADVKRRKDRYLADTQTTNTTMLDSASRDSWLPFKPVQPPTMLMRDLDDSRRALVLGAVLFILLSLESYPAHSRVLLVFLCECFELPVDVLSSAEATTAVTLLKSAESAGIEDAAQTDEARLAQAEKSRSGRKWKIGLATVAGAVAIGITGGLAAPLLLGAAGAIMGGVGLGGLATLLGATIANPITIAALFGALGGRMTGKAMEEYAREVEDFRFMPTTSKSGDKEQQHKLRVAIGVSGWIQGESDVVKPWKVFSDVAMEPFGLRYELTAMTGLANMLDTMLKDCAYSIAQAGALKLLLPVLSAAMLPVTLMKAGKFLDNPFTIAMERSDKAGKVLAHALIAKAQGERPVTLVGFSLGGRVIYSCLQELAAQKAFGLVENAVLIGAPVPSDASSWRTLRALVVGRLVNVYATKDFLLGYMYRARNAQLGVAGLQAILDVPGVENHDVTEIVTGHNQYRLAVGKILRDIHFTDLDMGRVEDEEMELEAEKSKEQAIHEEAKRNGLLEGDEDENGILKMGDANNTEPVPDKGNMTSTMRELQGLDLNHQHGDKQQTDPVELPVPETNTAKREGPSQPEAEVASPSPKRRTEPLTPTTSDDEDDADNHRPIQLQDLEPDAVPDTPPRHGGRH